MKKVFKLTVYRKLETPSFFGGRMVKENVGFFDSKEAAEREFSRLKTGDDSVQSRAISVDWIEPIHV